MSTLETAGTWSDNQGESGPVAAHQIGAEPAASTTPLAHAATALGAGLLRRKIGRRLARKTAGQGGVAPGGAVEHAAASTGTPLPAGLKQQFESSLGTDLSGVRVHTGDASAAAAAEVQARAYAVGNDIHFAAGQYDPGSHEGQHLLAHEVAHTVQQSTSGVVRQDKLEVGAADDPAEHEADRAAEAMLAGADKTSLVARRAPLTRQAASHSHDRHDRGRVEIGTTSWRDDQGHSGTAAPPGQGGGRVEVGPGTWSNDRGHGTSDGRVTIGPGSWSDDRGHSGATGGRQRGRVEVGQAQIEPPGQSDGGRVEVGPGTWSDNRGRGTSDGRVTIGPGSWSDDRGHSGTLGGRQRGRVEVGQAQIEPPPHQRPDLSALRTIAQGYITNYVVGAHAGVDRFVGNNSGTDWNLFGVNVAGNLIWATAAFATGPAGFIISIVGIAVSTAAGVAMATPNDFRTGAMRTVNSVETALNNQVARVTSEVSAAAQAENWDDNTTRAQLIQRLFQRSYIGFAQGGLPYANIQAISATTARELQRALDDAAAAQAAANANHARGIGHLGLGGQGVLE